MSSGCTGKPCVSSAAWKLLRAALLGGLRRQACIRRLSGKAALFSGDTAGAAADFQAAVELKPGALGAWEGIAQLKAASGEMAEAAETYQKLVRATVDCCYWALRCLRTARLAAHQLIRFPRAACT